MKLKNGFRNLISLILGLGGQCAILQPMKRKPYEPPKLTVFGDLKRLIRQQPEGVDPAGYFL